MPRLAVAGPNKLVTDAATMTAEAGGSVTDVAIVSSLTAMCSEPGICAPGAGGFMTIAVPDEDPVVIDGYVAAPGVGHHGGEVVHRSVTMEYGGGVTTLVDAGSIAVPGSFAALSKASDWFGHLPWSELMEHVASTVENGFPMGAAMYLYFQDSGEPIYSFDPASRAAIYNGDSLKRPGETVLYEDLADTLRYIGANGSDVFYKGDLAERIVDDLTDRGGLITREDMARYEAVMRAPLELDINGWALATNPPPAVGGVVLAAALAMIGSAPDPLSPKVWAESLTSAVRSRLERLEHADDLEIEAASLLGELGIRSPSTIAVSVVGSDGSAVATSFSSGYGSGVIPKGTGMLMNNCLGEIELTPGGMQAQVPGERLLSNMAPTVGRSAGQALAVSSPGASRITSALAISLGRVVGGDDGLAEAIEHPRVHPEFTEDGERIAAEPGLDLSHLEMPVRWFEEPHMYFGGVNGAALLDGDLQAHADSRRTGSIALID